MSFKFVLIKQERNINFEKMLICIIIYILLYALYPICFVSCPIWACEASDGTMINPKWPLILHKSQRYRKV